MSDYQLRIPREELRAAYEDDKCTIEQLRKRFKISPGDLIALMDRYGIPRRSPSIGRALTQEGKKFKADPLVLANLYITKKLPIIDVAKELGTTYWTARECLLNAGIKLRSALSPKSCSGRNVSCPTRDDLMQYIHVEHLPLREIGALYGIDGSSIRRWIKKLGVPAPDKTATIYRDRGGRNLPSKEELSSLIEQRVTLEEIAARFKVARALISRLCDQYAIVKRPGGYVNEYYECSNGLKVKSSYERRVVDWLVQKKLSFVYEPRLPFCTRKKGDFLVNGWYIEIWGVAKSNQEYVNRRLAKICAYKANSLPLIGIECYDFDNGRSAWERKLGECLTPASTVGMLPLIFD